MADLSKAIRLVLSVGFALALALLLPSSTVFPQYFPSVHATDWSVDGKRIAVGYDDGMVNILDASTSETLLTVDGGMDSNLMSLDWSPEPNPNWLAIANMEGRIMIFDADSGRIVNTILDNEDCLIRSVSWKPDGTALATGHETNCSVGSLNTGVVKVWDTTTGQLSLTLGDRYHSDGPNWYSDRVTSVTWSPDSSRLAGSATDGTVIIWDAETGEQLTSWFAEGGALKWSPDGSKLTTITDPLTVQFWDSTTYQPIDRFFDIEIVGIHDYEWSPSGQYIALGGPSSVHILDVKTEEVTVWPVSGRVYSIAWNPDGTKLLCGGNRELRVPQIIQIVRQANSLTQNSELKTQNP